MDGWGTNSYYSGEMDGYSGSVRKSDDQQYNSGYDSGFAMGYSARYEEDSSNDWYGWNSSSLDDDY